MSFIEELAQKALKDEYFIELFTKTEKKYAYNFFKVEEEADLTRKEYIDLLRFADILSCSSLPEAKNMSYKVISLLYEDYKNDEDFMCFSEVILTKLGNFPAIKFLENKEEFREKKLKAPFEAVLERTIKETFQKDPHGEFFFTDSQYKIYEALKANNHYSFSGPTSLGKSFIIEAFIKYLVSEHNCNENIAVLVPTRALINQVTNKLKQQIDSNAKYKVLSHPIIPTIFRDAGFKYIFVFTPERLISYLSESNNPKIDYMFIDEAQKVISHNNSRSPLYYHAILQAERKSIRLYFASPNVPNSEVFLQLFEKSTNETMNIKESPVSQNRFFLNLIDNEIKFFSDFGDEIKIPISSQSSTMKFNDWLYRLGSTCKNIIYCNTVRDTVDYAVGFAETLPFKQDEKINELVALVRDYIHKDYFLIDCLKKGVAFHFGRLPQRIRERIEELFSEKIIDYVFCTSTLLEGVNLPAKNIFILSNAIGRSKFTDIDFWNLAGRAGRLTKELSGNIICTKIEDKRNRWDNLSKDLEVVKNKDIVKIEPLIIKGQNNFFKNLESALKGEKFTKKNPSQEEINIWNQYANIALIHEVRQDESVLKSNFIKKNNEAKEMLKTLDKTNKIPANILALSSTIKAKYQNIIWEQDDLSGFILPTEVDYSTCLKFLNILYDKYNWSKEEVGGHNPMAKYRERLEYFSRLMSNWMNSTPLNLIISNLIKYYENKGQIWDTNRYTSFAKGDRRQVNLIINSLISDIDNILRFKLKNYFLNYYLILREKLGEENSGANWAEFLEYGTTDKRIIELQNVGFPRHLAKYILENHIDCLEFVDGMLAGINENRLKDEIDKEKPEYKEILKVLV